jgi:hypothetical protein
MSSEETETGWAVVAGTDGVARLLGTLDELDPEATYTRSDLSDRSGVALKTLYLDGAIDECVSLGVFERVDDDDAEPCYRIDQTNDVARAARRFDDAVREATGSPETEEFQEQNHPS